MPPKIRHVMSGTMCAGGEYAGTPHSLFHNLNGSNTNGWIFARAVLLTLWDTFRFAPAISLQTNGSGSSSNVFIILFITFLIHFIYQQKENKIWNSPSIQFIHTFNNINEHVKFQFVLPSGRSLISLHDFSLISPIHNV